MKIVLMIVLLMVIGFVLLKVYNQLFKRNVNLALAQKEVMKLPDLNDLVSLYIVVCISVMFSMAMNMTKNSFYKQNGACVQKGITIHEDVVVEEVPVQYKLCKNQYDNIIFENHDETLNTVLSDYEKIIKQTEDKYAVSINKDLDAFYYKLRNDIKDQEALELYTLLSIYMNFYSTHTIPNELMKGR